MQKLRMKTTVKQYCKIIERSVGNNALNNAVNHCLRSWVRNVINEIIDDYFKRGERFNSSELKKDNGEYDESFEADLLYSIGIFLTNNGELNLALYLFQRSLSIQKRLFDDDHFKVAVLSHLYWQCVLQTG